jgi:hypothetical protein
MWSSKLTAGLSLMFHDLPKRDTIAFSLLTEISLNKKNQTPYLQPSKTLSQAIVCFSYPSSPLKFTYSPFKTAYNPHFPLLRRGYLNLNHLALL